MDSKETLKQSLTIYEESKIIFDLKQVVMYIEEIVSTNSIYLITIIARGQNIISELTWCIKLAVY